MKTELLPGPSQSGENVPRFTHYPRQRSAVRREVMTMNGRRSSSLLLPTPAVGPKSFELLVYQLEGTWL